MSYMGLPNRPSFKDEQIATLCFVFVGRRLGPPGEPLCMLPVGFHLLKKGSPGLIEFGSTLDY